MVPGYESRSAFGKVMYFIRNERLAPQTGLRRVYEPKEQVVPPLFGLDWFRSSAQ